MPAGILGRNNGLDLNFGFAGNYARQSDMIIQTHPNTGTTDILFGAPVIINNGDDFMGANVGGVINADATTTMENFAGFAAAEYKAPTGITLFEQGGEYGGRYVPQEQVGVFARGSISVICQEGTPEPNGAVYLRTVAGGAGENVQNLSANDLATSGEGILLTNCKWKTPKDERDVAEVRINLQVNV